MPTVVTESIGSSGGRDYTTLIAWEAATDNDLVAADEVRVGQGYADSVFTNQGVCVFMGGTTDATRYRVCEAAPGEEYDPVTDTGCKYSNNGNCLIVNEDYFQLRGWGAENTQVTVSGNRHVFNTWTAVTTEVLYERCVCLGAPNSQSVNTYGLQVAGITGKAVLRNCIFVGSGSGTDDICYGIYAQDPVEAYNCAFYRVDGSNGSSSGITLQIGAEGSIVENCIALSCNADFHDATGSIGTWNNNCSSDGTADDFGGSGHLVSQVATSIWEDPNANDFNLKTGSNALDAGKDLSSKFTAAFEPDSLHGAGANPDWEMGPYSVTIIAIGPVEWGTVHGYHRRLTVDGTDGGDGQLAVNGAKTVYIEGPRRIDGLKMNLAHTTFLVAGSLGVDAAPAQGVLIQVLPDGIDFTISGAILRNNEFPILFKGNKQGIISGATFLDGHVDFVQMFGEPLVLLAGQRLEVSLSANNAALINFEFYAHGQEL